MKRFILATVMALTAVFAAKAQDSRLVANYFKAMGSSSVTFTMSGTGLDGTVFKAQDGTMDIQYPNIRIEAAGHIICTNGSAIWLYNPATEELVISDSIAGSLLENSAMTVDNDGKAVLKFNNKNGSNMTFKLKKTVPHDKWPSSHFVLDQKALGDDVIVTDLRK